MARQMLMSWVPARKRWTKKYLGKIYVVSCRALGTPETKDASWRAANAWWLRKQAVLDADSTAANAPKHRLASGLATLAVIEEYERTGVLPRTVQVEGYGLPPTQATLPADLLARGEAQAAPVLAALDGMTARIPTEATVGGRAQEWYGVLRDGKKVPRFASYRRNLEVFLDQVGRSSPLESIGLMLNCGFYQSDVSDLTEDEVDWERGVITRGRSKTRQKGVVVTYKLWTDTFDLLRACRNVGAPVLDGDGRPRVDQRQLDFPASDH